MIKTKKIDDLKTIVCANISVAIIDSGVSQKTLAKEFDMHLCDLNRMANGHTADFSLQRLITVAEAIGYHISLNIVNPGKLITTKCPATDEMGVE